MFCDFSSLLRDLSRCFVMFRFFRDGSSVFVFFSIFIASFSRIFTKFATFSGERARAHIARGVVGVHPAPGERADVEGEGLVARDRHVDHRHARRGPHRLLAQVRRASTRAHLAASGGVGAKAPTVRKRKGCALRANAMRTQSRGQGLKVQCLFLASALIGSAD